MLPTDFSAHFKIAALNNGQTKVSADRLIIFIKMSVLLLSLYYYFINCMMKSCSKTLNISDVTICNTWCTTQFAWVLYRISLNDIIFFTTVF